MMREKIASALKTLAQKKGWPLPDGYDDFVLEEPKDPRFGHLATTAAMSLAKTFKIAPRDLAKLLADEIDNSQGFIESIEIAGPGFINFRFSNSFWALALINLRQAGQNYGRGQESGLKIQIEFVSANPTGPLHVGHGRGAALGDSLSRILSFLGHQVEREYYVNDAGRQMRILGQSALYRVKELIGEQPVKPEEFYQGDYVKDLAAEILPNLEADFFKKETIEQIEILSHLTANKILTGIAKDLKDFKVEIQNWFSERELYRRGLVEETFKSLEEANRLYRQDGALWFKSLEFGDDKDRVLVKSDGEKTYFAADIAYHRDKFQRGYDRAIDVWGADHHGYIPRVKAAVEALGYSPDRLSVVLVQLVNLSRDGQLVNMSTRRAEFVTLREVLDEVGVDAARFMFLTRSHDSALDFDLNLAKAQTKDNPVFYVQYVCARIHSLLTKAGPTEGFDPKLLKEPEEIELIKYLTGFPQTVQASGRRLEPHLLTTYLLGLAKLFHQYYAVHRLIVDEDKGLTATRIELAAAVRQVTAIGLNLLGVEAPDKM
ncbi:MAG: arginine--tRNA ligase [Deltaproteobacteria bacterium]|jgi:arginyl-tRNA synthetase|nr:arginine--tRNA ligase [Deltaproteobacteria bacterium]